MSFYIVSWLSLNFCTENSSTHNSWALFISPITCILLIWVSRSDFSSIDDPLLVVVLALFEIAHIRDGRHAIPTAEHKLVTEAHEYKCQENTLCAPASWVKISLQQASDLYFHKGERHRNICRVRESENRFIAPRNIINRLLSLSENVSWFNLFLLKNNFLAPVYTTVKPEEQGVVRRRSPLPMASRCFPLSHRLKIEMTGYGTSFWHDPQFQWSSCFPGQQRSGCRRSFWAHNLWEDVVLENCHALEEVVDLRSGLKMWPPAEMPR